MNGWNRVAVTVLVAGLALGSSACRKTVLKGRVDVPGNDVRNIAVRVVPERDIKAYFDAKAPQALAELDQRRRAFDTASRNEDAATRDLQQAYAQAQTAGASRSGVDVTPIGDGAAVFTYDKSQHTEAEAREIARGALKDASAQQAAAATRFTAEKPMLEDARSAGRDTKEGARQRLLGWETDMLADMPEKGTVVYTDAQGRFTAKLPRGGKAAVIATGDFKLGGTLQHRAWGLWVKLDAAEKAVALEPGNLLLATPRDSVLR